MDALPGSNRDASSESRAAFEGSPDAPDNVSGDFHSSEKRFDASQYAFFGRDVSQEIEIGGLDEEDCSSEQLQVPEDGEETFSLGKEESGTYGSASEAGEFSEAAFSTFLQLQINNTSRSEGEPGSSGNIEAGQKPNGGEAAVTFSQTFEPSVSSWLDHKKQEELGQKKWWPHSQPKSSPGIEVGGTLGPTSHQTQQWRGGELTSMQVVPPLPALHQPQRTQQALSAPSSGQLQAMQAPPVQVAVGPLPGQYRPYYTIQSPMGVMSSMTSYGGTFPPQYSSSGPIMAPLAPPAQWLAQSNAQLGSVPGSGSQQLPQYSSLLPPQVVLQYQLPHAQQLHAVAPPPFPHLKPQHMYHGTPPTPQMLPRMGENVASGDLRDLFSFRGRQTQRHHQHGLGDGNVSFRNTHSNGWQPLKSKYMTVEEIENIVRIQWAATHTSDPYVDDYYHQAVQSKLSAGSPHGRRHFAPSHLRDLPSHTRAAVEPHAYLQVDALGRFPFSSIRRPRPLLEVDSGLGSAGQTGLGQGESLIDGVPQHRPLEQEPMLAARIAIEDGLCLLLDVDDIDRLLSSSQPPDGGAQLRRRRQLLVEGLAASLQLADSNSDDAGGRGMNSFGLPVKDDLLFLRLVSLPKGRKFLTRYIQLLTPGSELMRIVAVAVFRHLRFLFGGVQSDPSTSAATVGLANAAAVSVLSFDLPALSACLAAVLLASEQPPLRPMGSPAGDGATVVLRAVLERATNLLTDRNAAYPLQNRALWQASFDAFFSLLAKYCTNKYDSIFHSLMMASPGNTGAINAAAALAMSKEMPVELLRASLPHTNDHQRNLLLEFTQRSISMGAFPSTEGHANTATVRGRS